MKMAESIVCLRLWNNRFPQDTERLLRLSGDSHYTLLLQSAKYCAIIQQDLFLDLLTNITHHPQNLLTFSNAQISTALHAYETFRADLPYPAYVKTQRMTETNSKNGMKTLPEATKHQTFGPQTSKLSTQNIGTSSPRSPMFLNPQLEKPAQST